jgi:NAD(P)-dependent dehydrogenase (short-subunit alcohol dehydrogenase family)
MASRTDHRREQWNWLGDRGCLCGAGRRKEELATLAGEIEARGGRASYVVADVSVAKDVERMVACAIETFGRLDYAVNNAGYQGQVASITDLPEEVWDRVLDINLKGAFLCLQHEARAMLAGGRGGAIVNVGSVDSFQGKPDLPGNHRHPDASAWPPAARGRNLRQHLVATCSHETRRQPGGDRPVNRLSVLRRCELHHRNYSDARWRIHSNYLTSAS